MSKNIADLKPSQILKLIRDKDMRVIKTLVRDGVNKKKIWTQAEVAEMVGVNISTVSRWVNNEK